MASKNITDIVFRFGGVKYLLVFITLIIFVHVMRSLNEVGITLESFENDPIIQDLVAKNNCFIPKSLKKVDWHDHSYMKRERMRKGMGEQGQPAYSNEKEEVIINYYQKFGLNAILSDNISLSRSLPDIRHPGCMKKMYIKYLPSVSVIIPFYDEHLNTLLRTVISIINRSPPKLVKEILLVDDASNSEFLKKNLEIYASKYLTKVKILKLHKHNGLIAAKLKGAREATGDVLVFLESHIEVNVNWLPPLLEPIALNYRTVMCPLIDHIDDYTFEYKTDGESYGGFDWSLNYKQFPLLETDHNKLPEPYENPILDGIFAISRLYFWKLGGYDPGLYIWGGEQYELSFKVWQCGGRILTAPCSRVGHVFHKIPIYLKYGYGDFIRKNYRRVIDVWMDKYAERVYSGDPMFSRIDPGDISHQIALRQKLKCKSFEWYISEVAMNIEIYNDYDPFPIAQGQVRPLWKQKLCVHADYTLQRLSLKKCQIWRKEEQSFFFTWNKDIKNKDKNMCWDLPESAPMSPIRLDRCHGLGGNQLWHYDLESLQIIQGTNNCLDWDRFTHDLYVKKCSNYSITQQWEIDYNTYYFQ